MPRFIIKIHDERDARDYYLEWSTIVDAPVTYGMSLEEFREYYRDEYGRSAERELEERLARVEKTGSSAHPPYDSVEGFFEFNRAGNQEESLGKEEILEKYCRNIPTEVEE